MRKLILVIAIAGLMASPIVLSQGRSGGGHPVGPPGGSVGGGQTGGQQMGSQMSGSRSGMERPTSREDARGRRDAMTPEQALFGLSTADRAKLLKDADLETRKAFGALQTSLARANGDSARTARRNAMAATYEEMASFGSQTAARAQELQSANNATRRAFGEFQAALARQQGLRRAADFGPATK